MQILMKLKKLHDDILKSISFLSNFLSLLLHEQLRFGASGANVPYRNHNQCEL